MISLLFICLVMLTSIGYVGHSLLSIYINYTCMLTILFMSFFFDFFFVLSVNGVLWFFCGVLFYKGSNVWGGKILITLKWKQELEFNIFLHMHLKSFILKFGLVCWLKMLWKFLLCYWCKTLLTNLFSFGGMNNVQLH